MKKFDFDKIVNRRGSNSYKWDEPQNDDVIPLWVADMDFEVAPAIREALERRVAHGVFGYTLVPDAYYEAVMNWFSRRHSWKIEREWIQYTTGVVPAVSVVIKALTLPGDQVIVQTPVYNCFFSSIRNNGCEIVESPLVNVDGYYKMDFDDLERKCANPRAKVLLLCNPHNPACRVWTAEELEELNIICARHGVVVLSDEIHGELVFDGRRYTPFASVSDECRANCVVCCSPSKSFNTAGLQIANIICSNADVRARIDRAININEVCDVNPFGVVALMAAYNESEEWLDALCDYIKGNYDVLCRFLRDEFPSLRVTPLEGTYLAWVDFSAFGMTSDELTAHLLEECGVMLNSGTMYGSAGEGFLRINLACPRGTLTEALERMKPVLKNLC